MAAELLVLIDKNVPGLTAKLMAILLQNGLKVNKYRKEDADNSNLLWVCFSTLNDQIDFVKCNMLLSSISGVLEIKQSTANDSSPKPNVSTQLDDLAKSIAKAYPDIVGLVLGFESSLEADARNSVLYELGEHVGHYIFIAKFKNYRIDGSIPVALSQLVLPALQPFTIANLGKMEIQLSLSPFCLNRYSPNTQCHFIAGFIAGLLSSPPDAKPVRVMESTCRAQGREQCVFNVMQS